MRKGWTMRVEHCRETIGGIEVIDAAFADAMLVSMFEFSKAKVGLDKTLFSAMCSRELFGADSEEYALWRTLLNQKRKEFKKCFRSMRKVMAQACPQPLEEAIE